MTAAPAQSALPVHREQRRGRRMVPPALVAGGLAAATIALHLRDPHQHGSWGVCPTYALFGVYCPGCGGLRAVNDLTDLHLGAAASSNLLFIASLPLLAFFFVRWVHGCWTGEHWQPSQRAVNLGGVAIGVLMVVFTVLRNTTAGAWLAP
ncbi:MAG TPA: DUF2752 domain-containing protein [Nocardioides sp.]|nr:DUF2752 domain-containing protein [Nocardioides sp.]